MAAAESAAAPGVAPRGRFLTGMAGVAVLALVFIAGLAWAKWIPYAAKAGGLSHSHTWHGGVLFTHSGKPGAAPTLSGAWSFTVAYVTEIWKGFAVALVIAAAASALVPRDWLAALVNRRTRLGQAVAGGAAGLPSLMCTCCTAPLAVSLRQRGATVTASLAYWVANPLLNPAVLVFLFLLLPWQYGVVRIVAGIAVVTGGSVLAARLAGPRSGATAELPPELRPRAAEDPVRLREFPVRFARALLRLAIVLIPVYFAVLLVLGYFSGWLSGGLDARLGGAAVLVCAVLGTLLVIPTGGEIPVILALTAAGGAVGHASGSAVAAAGALLITLPALSVPSMVMVGRALSWRATAAMAAVVTVTGVAAGLVLWGLIPA